MPRLAFTARRFSLARVKEGSMHSAHSSRIGALTSFAALIACGGSGGSVFGNDNNGSGGPGAGGNPGDCSNDPVGTNAACVTAMKNAALPAVNLVQMYDKSGSMGNPAEGGDPNARWIPINTGMKAFWTDPASAGYNA